MPILILAWHQFESWHLSKVHTFDLFGISKRSRRKKKKKKKKKVASAIVCFDDIFHVTKLRSSDTIARYIVPCTGTLEKTTTVT